MATIIENLDDFTDPAVIAFMEKRKQKLKQKKEEALNQEILAEAHRLKVTNSKLGLISGGNSASNSSKEPGFIRLNSAEFINSIPKVASVDLSDDEIVQVQREDEEEVKAVNNINNLGLDKEKEKQSSPPVVSKPPTPPPLPLILYDPTHILHPDNKLALKAACAMLQIAKRAANMNGLNGDSTGTQLATIWINQAAIHLLQEANNKPKQEEKKVETPQPKPLEKNISFRDAVLSKANSKTLVTKPSFRKDVIDSVSVKLGERMKSVNQDTKLNEPLPKQDIVTPINSKPVAKITESVGVKDNIKVNPTTTITKSAEPTESKDKTATKQPILKASEPTESKDKTATKQPILKASEPTENKEKIATKQPILKASEPTENKEKTASKQLDSSSAKVIDKKIVSSNDQNIEVGKIASDKKIIPTKLPETKNTPDATKIKSNDTSILWECKICTLLNKPERVRCDACGTTKPFK